jgi:hypothetical protein
MLISRFLIETKNIFLFLGQNIPKKHQNVLNFIVLFLFQCIFYPLFSQTLIIDFFIDLDGLLIYQIKYIGRKFF